VVVLAVVLSELDRALGLEVVDAEVAANFEQTVDAFETA
jgi:hypothetical protein